MLLVTCCWLEKGCFVVTFFSDVSANIILIIVLCCYIVISSPHLPSLSFQHLFFLHWSDSTRIFEANHVPLLSSNTVPGTGGHWPVQTHALECGEICKWAVQGGPSRQHGVVSADISTLYSHISPSVRDMIAILPVCLSATSCATRIFSKHSQRLMVTSKVVTLSGCGPLDFGCPFSLILTQMTSLNGIFFLNTLFKHDSCMLPRRLLVFF